MAESAPKPSSPPVCVCGHVPRHHHVARYTDHVARAHCAWSGCGCPEFIAPAATESELHLQRRVDRTVAYLTELLDGPLDHDLAMVARACIASLTTPHREASA